MSPAPSRRPAKGGNIKKGICQNHSYLNPDTGETGDCPKCASGEVISVNVQRLSDFRCPVCDSKLTPYKEKNNKKLIIGVASAAVVAASVLIGVGLNSGTNDPEPVADGTDTTEVVVPEPVDSIAPVDTVTAPPVAEPEPAPAPEPQPQPKAAGQQTVLGGAALLIDEGGYKTLRFKRDYTLDLGKADGSTLLIRAGEEIYNAHISHNRLQGGNYKNLAGEEQGIHGINVRL